MSNLNDLMQLQGALAAFDFNDRGELGEHRIASGSSLDPEVLDLLAHVMVANTCIASMQARGWEKMTGQTGFYPIDGFTMVGFDWSAVAKGNRGVVLENDQADYDAAFTALSG